MWSAARLIGDPLVHFLFMGMILFALGAWLGDEEAEAEAVVHISLARQEALRQHWRETHLSSPDKEQFQGLLEAEIREELLYREALSLKLHEADPEVRRRLVDRMRYLREGLAEPYEPTSGELQAFLRTHPERFHRAGTIHFKQLFFAADPAREDPVKRARTALQSLQGKADRAASSLADTAADLPRVVIATADGVSRDFGSEFSAAVFALQPGKWAGPLRSRAGLHLVFPVRRRAGQLPEWQEVAKELREAFLAKRYLAMLRARYRIEVEAAPAP